MKAFTAKRPRTLSPLGLVVYRLTEVIINNNILGRDNIMPG